jgi:hypothetical protein
MVMDMNEALTDLSIEFLKVETTDLTGWSEVFNAFLASAGSTVNYFDQATNSIALFELKHTTLHSVQFAQ